MLSKIYMYYTMGLLFSRTEFMVGTRVPKLVIGFLEDLEKVKKYKRNQLDHCVVLVFMV